MKRNYTVVILFFATGILLLSGCKKLKDDPYEDHTMPKEMYDYGYFLPGTYWVYEDSVSGAIDSVWVWDAYKGIDTLGRNNSNGLDAGIYDWFEIKTTSTHFNCDYYYWANSSRVAANKYYHLYREIISPSIISESISFFYPPEVGKMLFNYGDDTLQVKNFFSNIIMNTQEFSNAAIMRQSQNSTEEDKESFFTYAQKSGLIEKKIPLGNENWKLIRYNVIQ